MQTVGSMPRFRNYCDGAFINDVRYADHDVLNVMNLDSHEGPTTVEVDGVKV